METSLAGLRISPLAAKYRCPQPLLLIITVGAVCIQINNKPKARHQSRIHTYTRLFVPCYNIQATTCFKHSVLFKAHSARREYRLNKGQQFISRATNSAQRWYLLMTAHERPHKWFSVIRRIVDYWALLRDPTTSVLNATTLKQTTGAGITAAAGTRTCPPVVSHRIS
ncbi:hypothetical protein RF11_15294 [Thelohanellus kitauei]|uniref:Uncharacterized protein n=1 Tax=Thelohanellus kitauei TaxID=669202 RepID=A0A0C2MYK5_THEKT|nr:hypothetical protein RF11_15294 [Thelohanellus kitauei]